MSENITPYADEQWTLIDAVPPQQYECDQCGEQYFFSFVDMSLQDNQDMNAHQQNCPEE